MREQILARTNKGLDVFKFYIKGDWSVNRSFFSPFYHDTKPSCRVYFERDDNKYRFHDFGNISYNGDCFDIVGRFKGLDSNDSVDFFKILNCINDDMSLGCTNNHDYQRTYTPVKRSNTVNHQIPKMATKKSEATAPIKKYCFKQNSFSKSELFYWNSYGITLEVLDRYRVVSVSEFTSTTAAGKPYTLKSTINEPIFGYLNDKFIKIYRPLSDMRFLYGGETNKNYCFGASQLPTKGDIVFITGGEKDVLTLASRGFNAISFNSETAIIPHDIIKSLYHRFKHIVILYDMDKTGIDSSTKATKEYVEYGVKRLDLPLSGEKHSKDISDYFKEGYTKRDFTNLFIKLLDSLYSTTMTMLNSCEIDFNNPPEESEKVISIMDVPLGTQGNLLCITGGEGTGKSNYVASLLAGAIREEFSSVDTLGANVMRNSTTKAVLLYDTEQSKSQLFKNVNNLVRRAKLSDKPEEFKAFSLAALTRKERLNAIIQSMDRYYYEFGGIQMVVIDGVADLVRCANDEVESIAIVDELYRLAGIYNTCIITVLHYIPNGLKLRGHLGSEIQRKAAAILSIERDKDPQISVVKALKVRDGSPLDVPLIQFKWDKEKRMHCYLGDKPKEEKDKRKEDELLHVARRIFKESIQLTYNELCLKLQDHLDVKERTAKSYIKFMRDKKTIINDPMDSSFLIINLTNQIE